MKKFLSISFTMIVVIGLPNLAASVSSEHPRSADGQDVLQKEVKTPVEAERYGFSQLSGTSPLLGKGLLTRPPPRPVPGPFTLVECYTCVDCPRVLPNTTSKICPYSMDPTKREKCVVYVEKYVNLKNPRYIRGCASERGNCEDIKRVHEEHPDVVALLSCEECVGSKCNTNGASHSLVDLTMACFALVVTPLVAKYTLS